MKIYLVVQHNIKSGINCISAIFTKLEDAESFMDWYSEGDRKRIFYIQERELFDKFDENLNITEQVRNIF